ncbi:MAG: NADH-quinone oxidoreductase subunit J [bacterium]|nr:NADH-quinone oxidoreductase subunit J [bacterium]MBU1918147.1 NADH-quinone oxidoreductase subunit J [bacterium]
MILQKNPIASATCLVISFFSLAALFALLNAHFVAVLQILVYAGAIMVLFIFVIMLLNLKKSELMHEKMSRLSFFAIIIGLGLFSFLMMKFFLIPQIFFGEISPSFGTAQEVGQSMFTQYAIPFELIGILLLVGIIGAVLLGRKDTD